MQNFFNYQSVGVASHFVDSRAKIKYQKELVAKFSHKMFNHDKKVSKYTF